MEKKEYINLLDVLNVCIEFLRNPTEENVQKLDEIKRDMVVKSYLALEQKRIALANILFDIKIDGDLAIDFTVALAMALNFHGLLAYTNIIGGEDTVLHEPAIYDILQECGIFEEIEKYAGKDFAKLESMVHDAINFERIKELVETMSTMDYDKLEEGIKALRAFKMDLDPSVLTALGNITAQNDPILHRIKETIEDGAYKASQEIQKTKQNKN